MKVLFIAGICFLLTACTSVVDKKMNWFKLGEREAMRGSITLDKELFFEKYSEDNASENSFSTFQNGYAQGLKTFCEVSNAFQYGIKGGNYHGQCEEFPRGVEFKYEWSKAYQQFMFPEGPK